MEILECYFELRTEEGNGKHIGVWWTIYPRTPGVEYWIRRRRDIYEIPPRTRE